MMKQILLVSILSLIFVGCENIKSEKKTSTINGVEITEAYQPYFLNAKGSCQEENLSFNFIDVETYKYKPASEQYGQLSLQIYLKNDGNARARIFNAEYSIKEDEREITPSVDTDQWLSFQWHYGSGEIVLEGLGELHLINYNGDDRLQFFFDEDFLKTNFGHIKNLKNFGSFGNLNSWSEADNTEESNQKSCNEWIPAIGLL